MIGIVSVLTSIFTFGISAAAEAPRIEPVPIIVQVTPFPGIGEDGTRIRCLTLHTGITIAGQDGFGGLSAFRIKNSKATLLSDSGLIFTADIQHNDRGFITGLTNVARGVLAKSDGSYFEDIRPDAEGLTLTPSGGVVSLEGNHRIAAFIDEGHIWRQGDILLSEKHQTLKRNKGYEALTRLKDGRLVAISEGIDRNGSARVQVRTPPGNEKKWILHQYRPAKDFSATEVDQDPLTGDLIILERAYSRLKGPRARLVRVPVEEISQPLWTGTELARFSFLHGIDNMEGMEVERGPDGTLMAHLVSDDNYNDVQRTVLMGFSIDETPECLGQ